MPTDCLTASLVPATLFDVEVDFLETDDEYGFDGDDDGFDGEDVDDEYGVDDEAEGDDGYDHVPASIAAPTWALEVGGSLDVEARLARDVSAVCARLGWGAEYAAAVRTALEGKRSIGPVVEQLAPLADDRVTPLELERVARLRGVLGEHEEMSASVYVFSRFTPRVSYRQSLDLVRFFGTAVDVEEIEDILLEVHRYWYERDSLVQEHPSFLRWLTRLIDETSPAALKRLVLGWRHTCSDLAA